MTFDESNVPSRDFLTRREDDEAPERLSEEQFAGLKRLQAAGAFSARAFADATFVAPKEASRASECRDYEEYQHAFI